MFLISTLKLKFITEMSKNINSLDKAINNLIDVNKGKKINYFSYNLINSPNGMDKAQKEDDNLNQMLKNSENTNLDKDSSTIITVSESEIEKHLMLLDILLEMEMVNFSYF